MKYPTNTHMFTRNRKGDVGFTMVEMLVVIAIMAILASIAIPGNPFSSGDDVVYGARDEVVFNSRGTCNGGYVYLANDKNTTYGAVTRSSGVFLLRKWTGSDWE